MDDEPDYVFDPQAYDVPPMDDEVFDVMLMSELDDLI